MLAPMVGNRRENRAGKKSIFKDLLLFLRSHNWRTIGQLILILVPEVCKLSNARRRPLLFSILRKENNALELVLWIREKHVWFERNVIERGLGRCPGVNWPSMFSHRWREEILMPSHFILSHPILAVN